MAMFSAYFDASGSGNDKSTRGPDALFIAGFVAPVEKWLKFERRWLDLLCRYDITPPFHTTKFERARQGSYKQFQGNPARADAFRHDAIHVMNRYTNKAFCVGLVLPDLKLVFDRYEVPPNIVREPLAYCGAQICALLMKWRANRERAGSMRPSDKLELFFEQGDTHENELKAIVTEQCGRQPHFLPKEEVVPFQACDYLAWEHRHWLHERAKVRGPIMPRPSMLEIARLLPSDSRGFVDRRHLLRACEENGWPRRSIAQ
jgi:hypothetical protein